MSEQLWVCEKASKCNRYCNQHEPHSHVPKLCKGPRPEQWICPYPNSHCIPVPAKEEQLWVCDHAEGCPAPNMDCFQSPKKENVFRGSERPTSTCRKGGIEVPVKLIPYTTNKEPPMTATLDGKNWKEEKTMEYEIAKPFRPYDLIRSHTKEYNGQTCDQWFQDIKFILSVWGITDEMEGIGKFELDRRPQLRDHLIKWGFIRVKELELKPCPFCGSKDLRVTTATLEESVLHHCVFCMTCGGAVLTGFKKLVSDRWNKRV